MVILLNNQPLIEPFSIYVPEMTFEKVLEYATEDISCELLDGVLVIHSPASFKHENMIKFLIKILDEFGEETGLGTPIGSRFMMRLTEEWAPEPDIMFLSAKDQEHLKDNYLDGPASTVFEILSKTTRVDDIEKKTPQYLKMGVKEVWLIDPEKKSITIFWPDGTKLEKSEGWLASKVLTGFKIKPLWLWNIGKVSARAAMKEMGF
nr:Uma2 family endonuclease [Candidatus Sigynarchaeota archaeon]